MPLKSDQNYLKHNQYKTPGNLQARSSIHARFSTNPYGWWRWYWDQVTFPPGAVQALETGCGTGDLWLHSRGRLPQGARLVLTDLSIGMVGKTRQAVKDAGGVTFSEADTQALPFAAETFDVVFANFMLYHLPNLAKGVRELRRVLKPGGKIYAATVGRAHMDELHQLIQEAEPAYTRTEKEQTSFILENSAEVLSACFQGLAVTSYPDSLWVTEVEPLVAYIYSMWDVYHIHDDGFETRLRRVVEDHLARDGGVKITKRSGLVMGSAR